VRKSERQARGGKAAGKQGRGREYHTGAQAGAQSRVRECPGEPKVKGCVVAQTVARVCDEVARLRVRELNLEAFISREPGWRRKLREMPRDLKAMAPEVVPFDARAWERGAPSARTRIAAAVGWLLEHPGLTAAAAARRFGVDRANLLRSPRYREYRFGQTGPARRWGQGERTGGVERALRYLASHRPKSIAQVARAAQVGPQVLCGTPRFRKAWAEYARTAKLSPRSLGQPRRYGGTADGGRGDGETGGNGKRQVRGAECGVRSAECGDTAGRRLRIERNARLKS